MMKLPGTRPNHPRSIAPTLIAGVLAACGFGQSLASDAILLEDERSYAVFDAVFLQRDNAAMERAIVVDRTAPNTAVMSAGDLTSTIGTGARLLYGNYGEEDLGWEIGYLGVFGMSAARVATSTLSLLEAPNLAFAQQSGLNSASVARATDTSSINSIEMNLVFHEYDGGYNRRSGRPWQRCEGYDGGHVDWIGGFRWANLADAAVLSMPHGTSPQASTYSVNTSSNLFAAQVGTRGRMAFERWALEGWMKIGIAGTTLSQSQTMFDAISPSKPFRLPTSSDTVGMGMIADMNLSAVYRLDEVWGLRVGYNLMWLTGVALAPDQWDFTPNQAGGTGINGSGSVFLSGANLGLEARF